MFDYCNKRPGAKEKNLGRLTSKQYGSVNSTVKSFLLPYFKANGIIGIALWVECIHMHISEGRFASISIHVTIFLHPVLGSPFPEYHVYQLLSSWTMMVLATKLPTNCTVDTMKSCPGFYKQPVARTKTVCLCASLTMQLTLLCYLELVYTDWASVWPSYIQPSSITHLPWDSGHI